MLLLLGSKDAVGVVLQGLGVLGGLASEVLLAVLLVALARG